MAITDNTPSTHIDATVGDGKEADGSLGSKDAKGDACPVNKENTGKIK